MRLLGRGFERPVTEMSTNAESNKTQAKKPYEKPQVKQVMLKPEEAVLGACKSSSARGPIQSACDWPRPCRVTGS